MANEENPGETRNLEMDSLMSWNTVKKSGSIATIASLGDLGLRHTLPQSIKSGLYEARKPTTSPESRACSLMMHVLQKVLSLFPIYCVMSGAIEWLTKSRPSVSKWNQIVSRFCLLILWEDFRISMILPSNKRMNTPQILR